MKQSLILYRNSLFLLILVFASSFISCNNNMNDTRIVKKTYNETKITDISSDIPNNKSYLKVVEKDLTGVFNPLLALSEGDKAVSYLQFLPLLYVNRDFTIGTENSLTRTFQKIGNRIRFELKDIKWWDGIDVKSEDILYSLKIILSEKYNGDLENSLLYNIKGSYEYSIGETEEISGFKIINDKSFEIELIDSDISIEDALTFRPIPKHYYGKLSIDELPQLNNKPLGNGAYFLFDFDKQNYALLKGNDTFYYGNPGIDNVLIKNELSGDIRRELMNGEVDIACIGHDYKVKDDIIIKDNYLIYTQNKNYSTILEQHFKDANNSIDLGKFLLGLIRVNDFEDLSAIIKYHESIISKTNRIYYALDYPEFGINDKFNKISDILFFDSKPINIKVGYFIDEDNIEIAELINEIFKKNGIRSSVKSMSKYDDVYLHNNNSISNYIIVRDFRHGIYPDLGNILVRVDPDFKEFNRYKYLKTVYGAKNLEQRKKAYNKYINKLFDNGYARGIGTPVKRIAVRKGLRNAYISEFINWYEMDIWNISWEKNI